jgi:sterol desaturase/sphingolipid hydroxylase (fatty acid hydroxylase superfamily)
MGELTKEEILERIKKNEKRLSEDVKEITEPSARTMIVLLLSSLVVGYISLLHGINESWAWEVGRDLITVDGLIIGFVVLGFTFIFTRDFTGSIIDGMMKDAMSEFDENIEEYLKKNPNGSSSDFFRNEAFVAVTKPIYQTRQMLNGLKLSFISLVISLALAFFLLGMGDQTNYTQSAFIGAFTISLTLSFFFLLLGTYTILKTLERFAEQSVKSVRSRLISRMMKEVKRKLEASKKSEQAN